MTKISALIPTYNRRTHVLRAIDSVLAQTVPVDEIIVVDDGSTDGTAEAIRSRYGSRVAVFEQENAGVSTARNRGIREAQGDWIAFLDSDDVWFPTKIERQLEALATLGGDFGLCFTDCVFDGDPDLKSVFQETGLEDLPRLGPLEEPTKYLLVSRELIQSVLVLRSLLIEIDGFDEILVLREDTDLMFRLSFRTRFCFVADPLVQIDRTPSRTDGLCNLFTTRGDQKYDNLAHVYTKWLSMPEVIGTKYEPPVRELLREICYDSAECKIHDLRIGPAFHEIDRLRAIGTSYLEIVATLLSRKIRKLPHSFGRSEHRDERKPAPKPGLA